MALKITKNYATKFKRYGTKRSATLDSIEVHSIGCAQNTAAVIRNNMNQYAPGGITHAIISADEEDRVLEILPDDNVCWADAGYGNNHSYTFEICESDYMRYGSGASFTVTNQEKFLADVWRGYNTAVKYTAQKCQDFGFMPTDKLANGLHRVYSHNEARTLGLASAHVDPTHLWAKIGKTMDAFRSDVLEAMGQEVTPKSYYRVGTAWESGCIGQVGAYEVLENAKAEADKLGNRYHVYDEHGEVIYTSEKESSTGLQAVDLKSMSEAERVALLGPICKEEQKRSGILASVILAQLILESGYCSTVLAQKTNNCFGMKATLSGNTWESVWDGTVVNIQTTEQDGNGRSFYVYADFRKYPCIEDSLADHSAYLLGAMKGSEKWYAGLVGEKDYEKAITIIRKGGYATDTKYILKICDIIERWDLTQYEADMPTSSSEPVESGVAETPEPQYSVQVGAYKVRKFATAREAEVQSKGFNTFIRSEDNLYKVISGVYTIKAYAETQVKALKAAGIDAIIK